jgi:glycopeptide antibiotics resistance protein
LPDLPFTSTRRIQVALIPFDSAPPARPTPSTLDRLTDPKGVLVAEANTSERDTGARLGFAVLAYLLAVTFVIELVPFHFAMPGEAVVALNGDVRDFIAGVVLFLPLGFLVRLVRRTRGEPRWTAVALGAGVSLVLQCFALFEPQRIATVSDILANGVGAWLGALLHDRLARHVRISARTIGRMGLELPLMGLVYLLVPLLWLEGLAGGTPIEHFLRTTALGLCGASLLASIQRHYFGPSNVLDPPSMTIGAAVWFLTGALPGATVDTMEYLVVSTLVIMALVYARSIDRYGALPLNRRFEGAALRGAIPLFALYLGVLSAPLRLDTIHQWSYALGFPLSRGVSASSEWGRGDLLHLLEVLGALTLLGYMVAELRGRKTESLFSAVAWTMLICSPAVLAVEVLQGLRPNASASVLEALLYIAASAYGAAIYRFQREHVRWLLARAKQRH